MLYHPRNLQEPCGKQVLGALPSASPFWEGRCKAWAAPALGRMREPRLFVLNTLGSFSA